MRGATKICIFDQVMDAPLYVGILREFLLPFIRKQFPDCEYRFMQDNDPKHTSQKAREFYEEEGINWWPTPASSADMNLIERVWRELKFFIARHIKPLMKKELVARIMRFWKERMTPHKVCKIHCPYTRCSTQSYSERWRDHRRITYLNYSAYI